MALSFHPLEVLGLTNETPDAYTVSFKKPEGFDYKPGQYLTLKVAVGNETLRRAFSLSSSPTSDDHLSVTIKAIPGGRVSNHLRDNLMPGDMVDALPPMGKFFIDLDGDNSRHYVLIGAGSGITPLYSMLISVLETEPASRVTLIYGNRNEGAIIFRRKLEQLVAQAGGRLTVHHVLSQPSHQWTGRTGRVEGHVLRELLVEILKNGKADTGFYLCGPDAMMSGGKHALRDLGIADSAVFTEYYSAPVADDEETGEEEEESYEIVTQDVVVKLDGEERVITVNPDRSILHAAVDAGMDPPYACEEGVCCTCRAKLLSGLVQMNEREGLSDEELEAGFILTCQSHPLTADVAVEFG